MSAIAGQRGRRSRGPLHPALAPAGMPDCPPPGPLPRARARIDPDSKVASRRPGRARAGPLPRGPQPAHRDGTRPAAPGLARTVAMARRGLVPVRPRPRSTLCGADGLSRAPCSEQHWGHDDDRPGGCSGHGSWRPGQRLRPSCGCSVIAGQRTSPVGRPDKPPARLRRHRAPMPNRSRPPRGASRSAGPRIEHRGPDRRATPRHLGFWLAAGEVWLDSGFGQVQVQRPAKRPDGIIAEGSQDVGLIWIEGPKISV